jgi:lycopene cyclase domain-containing protein
MTYWGYHLVFTLPVLGLLWYWHRHRWRPGTVASWIAVLAIVMVFTTPWDNYAAALGIWGFGEGVSLFYPFADLAEQTRWLGHIPIEEYSFFVLEATMVCLVTFFFLPKRPRVRGSRRPRA